MSFCSSAAAKIWGPPLWAELHNEPNPSPEKLAAFKKRIPCPICLADFEQLTIKYPPDYSSPEAWFNVTWRWHDEVSAKNGNARITLEEAKAKRRLLIIP